MHKQTFGDSVYDRWILAVMVLIGQPGMHVSMVENNELFGPVPSFFTTMGFSIAQLLVIILYTYSSWHRARRASELLIAIACLSISAIPFFFATIYYFVQSRYACIDGYINAYDELYFSYTTLTTLGYGDLKPLGWCRAITSLEAVIGYVLLGTLVALMFHVVAEKFRSDGTESDE